MFASVLKECPLFFGIEESELDALLNCLSATVKSFAKDEFILMADNKPSSVGVVLAGGVYVIQEDYWGNRMILSHFGPGEMFGEAFSCAQMERLPVSVVAAGSARIMMIDYRKIITTCSSACVFHTKLVMNMLRTLADKNILLTRKMEFLSKRTTREKLMAFLSAQALRENSAVISIPFNRQELADYLCVARSALSRELSLMQREGTLKYDKNRFHLQR